MLGCIYTTFAALKENYELHVRQQVYIILCNMYSYFGTHADGEKPLRPWMYIISSFIKPLKSTQKMLPETYKNAAKAIQGDSKTDIRFVLYGNTGAFIFLNFMIFGSLHYVPFYFTIY